MLLGTATVDITPPVGVMLAGSTRRRPSVGMEDPLLCKAMVLESCGVRLALVTLDLIGLDLEVCNRAKARIQDAVGIPYEHVLINCSHTHSGPYTTLALDPDETPDPTYLQRIQDAIADSVQQAGDSLLEVRVGCASSTLPGIGGNRRLLRPNGDAINNWLASEQERRSLPPAGPTDDSLAAWVFFSGDAPVATLWSYTLHVNNHFGDGFSADYPGHVAAALEDLFGTGFFTLFLPGACGDINRRGLSLEELYSVMSKAVGELVGCVRPAEDEALAAVLSPIELPVRDCEPFQEEEIRTKWPDAFDVFENEHRLLSQMGRRGLTTTLQALRIGGGAIACTPGETFVKLGLGIKALSPYTPTVVAELCNDIIGYIPTREAYWQGGYETFRARTAQVAPGAGEQIACTLIRMLPRLGRPHTSAQRPRAR